MAAQSTHSSTHKSGKDGKDNYDISEFYAATVCAIV